MLEIWSCSHVYIHVQLLHGAGFFNYYSQILQEKINICVESIICIEKVFPIILMLTWHLNSSVLSLSILREYLLQKIIFLICICFIFLRKPGERELVHLSDRKLPFSILLTQPLYQHKHRLSAMDQRLCHMIMQDIIYLFIELWAKKLIFLPATSPSPV